MTLPENPFSQNVSPDQDWSTADLEDSLRETPITLTEESSDYMPSDRAGSHNLDPTSSGDLTGAQTTSNVPSTPILISNRYRVLSVLGDGGFGQTFLVEDTHMPSNRRCVLKQLKPSQDDRETQAIVQERFQREAATLETLGEAHDQIPQLYAYFKEGEQFYLVEQWVDGDTLTQKVQRDGKLSEAATQDMVASLLDAIACVHSQRIVHRDIKPDNIIVRRQDGQPVLIDFGAVKEAMNTTLSSPDDRQGSSHSIVVGTPGFMPSEQLSGRPVYASDIYSLGLSAIYMLTGKLPQELALNPQTGELLWRDQAPHISPEFANFLNCAIHMNAQHRFQNVSEMQSILNTLRLNRMQAFSTMPVTQHPPETATDAENEKSDLAQPAPITQNSAQTVVSASPTAAPHTGAPTQVVSPQPQYNSAQLDQQAAQARLANPAAHANSGSGPSMRSAVIVGSIIGFSLLMAVLLLIERLPSVIANSNSQVDSQTALVEPDASKSEPDKDSEKTEAGEDTEKPETANRETSQPQAPAPAPKPAAAPNANSTVVGSSGSKNVRSGPGTGNSVMGVAQVGDRLQVVDAGTDSQGYPWYRVVTPTGTTGWIAGQLLQIDGDAPFRQPTTQPTPAPKPTPPTDSTNASVVGSDSKNVRSGPGTGYSIKYSVSPGTRITILDSAQDSGGYTWHKIAVSGSGQGWIAAQLVDLD